MTAVNALYSESPTFDLSHKPITSLKWKAANRFRNTDKTKQMVPSAEEATIIQALRNRDEKVFVELIDHYHSNLIRLAKVYVPNEAVAEEVVQETWVGVLEGIYRFEGRSSLKTWIFQILINRAKTRGMREKRYVPFTQPEHGSDDSHTEYSVDSAQITASMTHPNHRTSPSTAWDELSPERLYLSKESLNQIKAAIDELPPVQQKVILLRDVEGMNAPEVGELLGVTDGNQRVLLHRARSAVRRSLVPYLKKDTGTP